MTESREDAASVLEQFVHDVANLPAEVAHLMEEMAAKDQQIQECRSVINTRDSSIQKFIKLNGSLVKNPKEEPYSKIIMQNFEQAQILQEEKVGLSEKAVALLERHVKRLDIKIRDLQTENAMPMDPTLPSLLRESSGNLVPPASSAGTGASTPLNPLSINTTSGGAPNIANAAMARMASAAVAGRLGSPSVGGMQPHPLITTALTSLSTIAANHRQREASVGSDAKRRRPNASLGTLPAHSSNLARQSSLGPGTPKPGTPGAGSRAGSAGPRPAKKITSRKIAPHQQVRKKVGKGGISKKSARRIMGHNKASPSTGDEESVLSEGDGSDAETSGVGHDGAADDDGMDVDEDDGDDRVYCTCQSISYGDMVACDNENCQYQWFHWGCVGLKTEPQGEWLCPACRTLPPSKIKKAR